MTDIIEAVNGEPVSTIDRWRAGLTRIAAGDIVTLRLRTNGRTREVQVTAAVPIQEPEDFSLGLRLRTVPGVGAEVLAVEPRSRSDRAGLMAGDLITVIGAQKTPTAAQVPVTFDSIDAGARVLVAFTRAVEHRVAVLEKTAGAGRR